MSQRTRLATASTARRRVDFPVSPRRLLLLAATGLLFYIVLAGIAGLDASVQAIRMAHTGILLVAFLWVTLSYAFASISYLLLAEKHIRFLPTFLVTLAGGLVNRLLPGGLGGLGLNAVYLHKNGHTWPVASAVVAANNILGFIGNMLLLVSISVLSRFEAPAMHISTVQLRLVVGLLLIVCMLIGFTALSRRKLASRLAEVAVSIRGYFRLLLRRPYRSFLTLVCQCGITACHATALYFVGLSLGVHAAHWPVALMAVSAGSMSGALVPSPGGIGGAEAGIAAALAAYGIPGQLSVATAVMYRFLTYWLPLLPGFVALRLAQKRYL